MTGRRLDEYAKGAGVSQLCSMTLSRESTVQALREHWEHATLLVPKADKARGQPTAEQALGVHITLPFLSDFL